MLQELILAKKKSIEAENAVKKAEEREHKHQREKLFAKLWALIHPEFNTYGWLRRVDTGGRPRYDNVYIGRCGLSLNVYYYPESVEWVEGVDSWLCDRAAFYRRVIERNASKSDVLSIKYRSGGSIECSESIACITGEGLQSIGISVGQDAQYTNHVAAAKAIAEKLAPNLVANMGQKC